MTDPALQAVIDRILAVYRSWGPGTTIADMRADWDRLLAPGADLPPLEPFDANGVNAAWVGGAGAERSCAILYLHGGGFQVGSLSTHQALMTEIAKCAGCAVLGVDYRLAPEHRFPSQLDDALAAYDWLRAEGFAPDRIALAGDSAGGGLAVSLLLRLKDRGDRMPAAAAVMSPWTDMEATGASYRTHADLDPFHQRDMISTLARTYLGRGGDPRDPFASPIHGDFSRLPPLLIQVGGRETLLDDARVLAQRAAAAGVDVTLEVEDPMVHVFQLYFTELAEARAALERLSAFLRRHLAPARPE